ncbi:MAG: DHA2 family efflux MFS transporter permease subunit [Ignavibacteriaceae bacterium]|jgi:DHA2 family multidrug resistance protein|nr:DHA2 family efflux MFS transporter permease subunit [Ignavibacteriaceae bacterium]MCW8822508.1 DHA2 family efflux MFS transporter permease subunit [Ignavibacteriaceae bacterium]MCW8962001.1 DHA2 family efflux MFS transporter permease subunit [Ignavibacteriaceae bacterium]
MANNNKNSLRNRLSSLDQHPSYKWFVLANVMIGTFMAVLDVTIVNVGLTKMMAAFGVSVDKIEWVLTAYLLIFAVVLPSSGWIADHLGYKKTYFLGLLLFTGGSFLCSLSTNENMLIMFRVLQGSGAGFIMPVGMAIVTREFPPEKRGMALGFWGIAAASSVSLGPMLGGYLIDTFSWHAIFDVNVPVGIFALIVTLIIQREYKTEHTRSFDLIGFISMTLFLVFLLLALSDGNAAWNTGGWTSDFILTCFAISFVSFVIFITAELTVKYPIVDLRILKNRNFGLANIMLFIFGLSFFGNAFLLPLYLQNSLGYTALQAGLVFFPVGIIQAIMSPIAGKMSDKLNPKIPIFIGIVLTFLSMYLYKDLSLYSEYNEIIIPLIIRGFGLGFMFIPLSTIAINDIPKVKIAQATGLFNTIRQVGGSFGVAILGSFLTRRVIYHTEMFSEAVNQNSAVFKQTVTKLNYFVQHSTSSTGAEMAARSKALIAQNIANQAFVQGIADDFLAGALITLLIIIPLLFLRYHKNKKGESVEMVE